MRRSMRPVRGSSATSWFAALASTYSVRRSHDGVTCWDSSPVCSTRTILCVRWSITVVVGEP
jgi:hypothetical protein